MKEDFYKLETKVVHLKEQIEQLEYSEDPKKKEKGALLRKDIEKEWAKISPRLTALSAL